ncbi:MAG: hypothetical protein H7A45_04915 [Verrucomicrobiales bacterium]|nr:hypothetical protein [Verrucomicrobiales bacterium]
MNELRLLFNKTGNGDYTVHVVPAAGNASEPVPFQPFLTDKDHEDLR